MFKALSLITLSALLTSCGGLSYYVHDDVPAPAGKSLAPVTLSTGETIKALKHSSGLIWGGYKEGITIEDPSIVAMRYGKDGDNSWDSKVYLTGLKPGTTRAVYCNRIGQQPDFSKDLDNDFKQKSFQIIVR